MKPLIFCTGNNEKFANAELVCNSYGIDLLQKQLEITEIQSEDSEEILKDKLSKAYGLIGELNANQVGDLARSHISF